MAKVIVARSGPLAVFQRSADGGVKVFTGKDVANAARFAGLAGSSATASQNWAEGTEPGGSGTDSAKGWATVASGHRVRASNAVPFTTWTALAAATGMSAGDKATVLAADTGTHTDPVVGGTVNNAGVYTYSASPAGWRRTGNLDSQTAASSVGAVKQIWPFGTYNVTTAAWYFAPGLPVQTAFDRLRVFLTGTGTADIYIQANDVNILGPIAVTTTPTSNTISVTVPAGQTLSFQLANITGTPTAILGQMEGLPS